MPRHLGRLLVLGFVAAYLVPLGCRPLALPDEVRYAEISREMLATGDWVVPRLLGLLYFEKPVGGYWAGNLAQSAFGHSAFAVRLPSALAAGLCAWILYALVGRVTGDRRKGLLAAAVQLSSVMGWAIATDALLDSMLCGALTSALACAWLASEARGGRARLAWWCAFGVACGAAFLVKGFIALAVPVSFVAPYWLWQRRWRELVGYGLVAVATATVVSLPWALAIHAREPDFWHQFFWNEHVRRFSADDAQHGEAAWYYLPWIACLALPWLAALPGALADAWRAGVRGEDRFRRYLLLAVVMPVALFSASKGKLPTYVLPCLPPLAALVAMRLVDALDAGRERGLVWTARVIVGASVLLLAGLVVARVALAGDPQLAGEDGTLAAAGVLFLAWAALGAAALARRAPLLAAPLGLVPLLAPATPLLVPEALARKQMPEAAIRSAARELPADATIASASVRLALAVAWELERADIVIVGGTSELEYGLARPEAAQRHVVDRDFAAWLAAERARRPVALFALDRKGEHVATFPAPDATVDLRPVWMLRYDR
ncbi:MAG: phospholipid carrier-dependent glycosyltransferase [Planctomycetes bacterium]|nr:phospholipid carrier-dependent glycosyltransferase [Planctomycetota bacterium]